MVAGSYSLFGEKVTFVEIYDSSIDFSYYSEDLPEEPDYDDLTSGRVTPNMMVTPRKQYRTDPIDRPCSVNSYNAQAIGQ